MRDKYSHALQRVQRQSSTLHGNGSHCSPALVRSPACEAMLERMSSPRNALSVTQADHDESKKVLGPDSKDGRAEP